MNNDNNGRFFNTKIENEEPKNEEIQNPQVAEENPAQSEFDSIVNRARSAEVVEETPIAQSEVKKDDNSKKADTRGNTDYLVSNLMEDYIGPNSYKIMNKKVSIPPFFIGHLYLFYRRMYLFGLIFCIITLLLSVFDLSIYSILINIALVFLAYPLYLFHVKRKIRRIINANPDKGY